MRPRVESSPVLVPVMCRLKIAEGRMRWREGETASQGKWFGWADTRGSL